MAFAGLHGLNAQAPGIKRIDIQKHDLSVPGREIVQARVEFEPGAKPSYLDLSQIEEELSCLLAGRRVDLRTPPELSRYFRDQVLRDAEVQYDAG